tara:strand:- start:91 stop:636 length:546 start_codon:yes stop_codon:yes gene_type:complete
MIGKSNDFEQASEISGSIGKTAVNEKKDTSSSQSNVVACDMDLINGKDVVYQIVDEEEVNDVVVVPKETSEVIKPYEETVVDLSTAPEVPEKNVIATDIENGEDAVIESPLMLVTPMEKLEVSTCVGFSMSMKDGVHEAYISRCPILPDNSCPVELLPEYNCVSTKINVDHLNISSLLKNM